MKLRFQIGDKVRVVPERCKLDGLRAWLEQRAGQIGVVCRAIKDDGIFRADVYGIRFNPSDVDIIYLTDDYLEPMIPNEDLRPGNLNGLLKGG